mgnify:CR=1 FL=1
MKILVTGAKGFVGKNLVAQLKNIQDGSFAKEFLSEMREGKQANFDAMRKAASGWAAGSTGLPQRARAGSSG